MSVITVCRNSADTIERTIKSVAMQSYRNVQYIVVDGGSTDRTLDIIREYERSIEFWISEKDRGISDAFNKGISLAEGEFVMLVNADDWLEPDHLQIAVEALSASDAEYVFGSVLVHEPGGGIVGKFRGEAEYAKRIAHIMPNINHPTVVCRRRAYVRYGLFNNSLHHAMDYEWLLRLFRQGIHGVYLPNLVSHMTLDGRSDRHFVRGLAEVRAVSIAYGYPAAWAWGRFVGRVAKGYARRWLKCVLPEKTYKYLRSKINGNFEGQPCVSKGTESVGKQSTPVN